MKRSDLLDLIILIFKKILTFFNLKDRSGNLSLTNTALIILMVKLAIAPEFSITEVSAFFIALLNYGHKRSVTAKAESEVIAPIDMGPLEKQLQDLSNEIKGVSEVAKDAMDKASKASLALGFGKKPNG